MSEPPSNDPPRQDPPPRDAPRPLPPSYNAPRTTPPPYIPPRPVQPHRTDRPQQPARPHAFDPGQRADTSGAPEPPTPRSSNRLGTIKLVLFVACVLVIGVSFMIYNAGQAERDEDGAIAEAGTIYSDELVIGDCIEELDDAAAVADVSGVPCSEPHVGEVVGVFDLPDGSYPGEQEIFREADARCDDLLLSYAPGAYADRPVGVAYLFPTKQSWTEHRGREVTCIATSLDGTPMSGRLTDP